MIELCRYPVHHFLLQLKLKIGFFVAIGVKGDTPLFWLAENLIDKLLHNILDL
jgi:hypothetical protein